MQHKHGNLNKDAYLWEEVPSATVATIASLPGVGRLAATRPRVGRGGMVAAVQVLVLQLVVVVGRGRVHGQLLHKRLWGYSVVS